MLHRMLLLPSFIPNLIEPSPFICIHDPRSRPASFFTRFQTPDASCSIPRFFHSSSLPATSPSPLKETPSHTLRTRWRLGGRPLFLRHPKPALADSPQEALECLPDLTAILLVQQLHRQGVKGFNVSLKIISREVGIPLHDVDHHWPPCLDVARLGFIQEVERADDVGTEPG